MIKRFVLTEKALMLAERENKLTVIVDRSANRKAVREAMEKLYGVKVAGVNVMITPRGEKKAIVKLAPESNAFDLLSRLGLL
ncbi:MAG: 50S ribosomal protein L23 [Thermoproteus sp.]|nr:50S ribosomal protein L23 [Thermoproteus sp.]